MSNFAEAKGVRDYIVYVHTRVKLIQANILSVEDNQYIFYLELSKHIKKFASTHKLFFGFLLGKYDSNFLMNMLGCSIREVFRFLEKQRKKFVNEIQAKENELFSLYPFTGEYMWLHERSIIS